VAALFTERSSPIKTVSPRVVFWHIRENVWADETQTRDLRSVGATERTNRDSLTAFGDFTDAG